MKLFNKFITTIRLLGDREAIVVGAGLCDGEGERAYTAFAPHYDISGS